MAAVLSMLPTTFEAKHTHKEPSKNDLVDYSAEKKQASVPQPAPRKGYVPTTSREKIEELKQEPQDVLKLDWNEGTISPPKSVLDAMMSFITAADGAFLKWYPHLAGGEELRKRFAEYAGCNPENLLITNGSDDALILILSSATAVVRSGVLDGKAKTNSDVMKVMAPCPTYEHFCVNAIGSGAQLIRLAQPDPFKFDPDVIAAGIEQNKPNLVYLVSPNNPTGTEVNARQIEVLSSRFPAVMFIVDEAYHEFSSIDPTTKAPVTCVQRAIANPNVMVTRTFSKAFCLASVRCGVIVAHPNTIAELRTYYNPKSVNQFAQVAASAALKEYASYYAPYIHRTNESRENFIEALQSHGVKAQSGGSGNFVCIAVPGKTRQFCVLLEAQAIYVRDISDRFPGYVRITIGLEMEKVVDAVVSAVKELGV